MGLMVDEKKLKHKAVAQLKARLKKATDHFERPDPDLHMIDQAFNVVSYQEDDYGEENTQKQFRFNEYEVRDAFLEFMQTIMANYTLHLVRMEFGIILFRTRQILARMFSLTQETFLIQMHS